MKPAAALFVPSILKLPSTTITGVSWNDRTGPTSVRLGGLGTKAITCVGVDQLGLLVIILGHAYTELLFRGFSEKWFKDPSRG